jgi:hypothetical protein
MAREVRASMNGMDLEAGQADTVVETVDRIALRTWEGIGTVEETPPIVYTGFPCTVSPHGIEDQAPAAATSSRSQDQEPT